ncbi:MAG: hypothetical protein R3E02_08985 [Blastomonas sp.]
MIRLIRFCAIMLALAVLVPPGGAALAQSETATGFAFKGRYETLFNEYSRTGIGVFDGEYEAEVENSRREFIGDGVLVVDRIADEMGAILTYTASCKAGNCKIAFDCETVNRVRQSLADLEQYLQLQKIALEIASSDIDAAITLADAKQQALDNARRDRVDVRLQIQRIARTLTLVRAARAELEECAARNGCAATEVYATPTRRFSDFVANGGYQENNVLIREYKFFVWRQALEDFGSSIRSTFAQMPKLPPLPPDCPPPPEDQVNTDNFTIPREPRDVEPVSSTTRDAVEEPKVYTFPLQVANDSSVICTFREGNPETVQGTMLISTAPEDPCGEAAALRKEQQMIAGDERFEDRLAAVNARLAVVEKLCPASGKPTPPTSPPSAPPPGGVETPGNCGVPGQPSCMVPAPPCNEAEDPLRCKPRIVAGPFPSAPIPESLPPCEELQRVLAAIEKESKDQANEEYSEADRAAARERYSKLVERERELRPLCRGFVEKPFPSPPIPEDIPPCEQINLIAAAIQKANEDSFNTRFSEEDRAAARQTESELRERFAKLQPLCRGSRPPLKTPPSEISTPVPVPAEDPTACERFRELLKQHERLSEAYRNAKPGSTEFLQLNRDLVALDEQLLELVRKCPSGTGLPFPTEPIPPQVSEPQPTPAAPPEKPSPPKPDPEVEIFVKASTKSVERGQQATEEIAGQQVKMMLLTVAEMAMPDDEDLEKPVNGSHAKDPVQGVTNELGKLVVRAAFADVFGPFANSALANAAGQNLQPGGGGTSANDGSRRLQPLVMFFDIDTTREDSRNFIIDNDDTRARRLVESLTAFFGSAGVGTVTTSKIGDKTLVTSTFPDYFGERFAKVVTEIAPGVTVEVNLCRTKEPLGPRPEGHFVLPPPEEELRGAKISLAPWAKGEGE